MPKCCVGNKILKQTSTGLHHGFECVDSSSKLFLDIELTNKTISKTIENHQAEIKFVSEVFPACAGLGTNWNYEYHNQFSVNVLGEKYNLFLKGSKVSLDICGKSGLLCDQY